MKLLQYVREPGILLVAHAPLMRGALTGQFQSNANIPKGDARKHFPKFQDSVLASNIKVMREVEKLAGWRDGSDHDCKRNNGVESLRKQEGIEFDRGRCGDQKSLEGE